MRRKAVEEISSIAFFLFSFSSSSFTLCSLFFILYSLFFILHSSFLPYCNLFFAKFTFTKEGKLLMALFLHLQANI